MYFEPADPDLSTIVSRISDHSIDLQPEFQRGEVWSEQKKQRLIDTILRRWIVPAIIVVEGADSIESVLDGQQRLVAIRDFVLGDLRVHGRFEPPSQEMAALHGLRYKELPPEVRRRFDKYTLRWYRVNEVEPGAAGELFFRLNQPISLNAAEQRNALFGPVRNQVREITQALRTAGLNSSLIGFSNQRMAIDDVIARVLVALEAGSLRQKITSNQIEARYRAERAFDERIVRTVKNAGEFLAIALSAHYDSYKLNKATLFSWLVFLAELEATEPTLLSDRTVWEVAGLLSNREVLAVADGTLANKALKAILRISEDRSSARVADAASVLARHACMWMLATFAAALRADSSLHLKSTSALAALKSWTEIIAGDEQLSQEPIRPLLDSVSFGGVR